MNITIKTADLIDVPGARGKRPVKSKSAVWKSLV
jgi:hypothetical protein